MTLQQNMFYLANQMWCPSKYDMTRPIWSLPFATTLFEIVYFEYSVLFGIICFASWSFSVYFRRSTSIDEMWWRPDIQSSSATRLAALGHEVWKNELKIVWCKKGTHDLFFFKSGNLSMKPLEKLKYTINNQIWKTFFLQKGVPTFVNRWVRCAHLAG